MADKMKSLTLSQECISYIDSLDKSYEEDYPSPEDKVTTVLFKTITKTILMSREAFLGEGPEVVENFVKASPDFAADQLDDFITRIVLQDVQGMVKRIMQLSHLEALFKPSKNTAKYIREATRLYIYGFSQACAAISRAALEQALKEKLGHQGSGEFLKFQDLLKEAKKWNIVDENTERQIRDTANKADLVLHEKPTDLEGAFEVLIAVRGLLQLLYSTKGGF